MVAIRYLVSVKDFLVKNEKKVLIVVISVLFISASTFDGTVVGQYLDKFCLVGTVLANCRILELI